VENLWKSFGAAAQRAACFRVDHPPRLVLPDDLSNPLRSVHRVKTVTCRKARNTMMPRKNDKSAISTHASRVNAKDKPAITLLCFPC
jgi:hypothetical protein